MPSNTFNLFAVVSNTKSPTSLLDDGTPAWTLYLSAKLFTPDKLLLTFVIAVCALAKFVKFVIPANVEISLVCPASVEILLVGEIWPAIAVMFEFALATVSIFVCCEVVGVNCFHCVLPMSYTFITLFVVSKYKAPSTNALPSLSTDGLEDLLPKNLSSKVSKAASAAFCAFRAAVALAEAAVALPATLST